VHVDSLKRVHKMVMKGSNCEILIARKAAPPPPDNIHISNSLLYCILCAYSVLFTAYCVHTVFCLLHTVCIQCFVYCKYVHRVFCLLHAVLIQCFVYCILCAYNVLFTANVCIQCFV
jgi:4-hydroxybenzoate polyprenyltransferase